MSSLPTAPAAAPRCGTPRASRRSRWRVAALVLVHLVVLVHVAHYQISGSSLSPLEPSEAMQTLELGYVNAGFLLLVGLVLLTLVVGRFFCGWACHVVAYQDLSAWLLGKLGLRPRPVRSRLLLLVPLGAAFYMFLWPTIDRLLVDAPMPALRWHLRTDGFWETFPGPGIALLTFVVDGFLVVWLLGAKGFCTYGCPYGAIFGLADRAAPGRIVVNDDCEGCGHCTATCTSNVDVRTEVKLYGQVVDAGCMKCMDCVSVCPKEALSFGFVRPRLAPKATKAPKKKRPRRHWDFSWGAELVLAAVFLLALFAWRDLYGLVPFLLALGLAVLSAVGAVAFTRLLRESDFRWQGHVLRRGGRWTLGGRIAAGVLGLGLGLVAHSALVQWGQKEGTRRFEESREAAVDSQRRALLDQSFAHLRRSASLGLLGNHELDNMLALVEQGRGNDAEAERYLRRAIEASPSVVRYRGLYGICARQRDAAGSVEALQGILELAPGDEWATVRLETMRARGLVE